LIELPIETLLGKSCKYISVNALPTLVGKSGLNLSPYGILLESFAVKSSINALRVPFKFEKDDDKPVTDTNELLTISKFG